MESLKAVDLALPLPQAPTDYELAFRRLAMPDTEENAVFAASVVSSTRKYAESYLSSSGSRGRASRKGISSTGPSLRRRPPP